MATVELFLQGNQIARYTSVSSKGNANGMQVNLGGVTTLGSASDTFRIVVSQVNNGQTAFQNGQWVSIYSYPDNQLVATQLNPQDDQFQGRASSSTHMIFTNPSGFVIDLNGINDTSLQYGPGENPHREERLPFAGLETSPPATVCFTPGVQIRTGAGSTAVEDLRIGDKIWTRDHGLQRIRWIGRRQVAGIGPLAPVTIAAGTFGNRAALRVSQQHRILIRDWRAQLWFGLPEVLVAARHLVDGERVQIIPVPQVEYLHLALDRHEVIEADGMLTESLYLGDMAMSALPEAARREVMTIFPELLTPGALRPAARPCLAGYEGKLLGA
ncbi:Hint domain-containing protein [Phaeovulum sp. W22_SRMD_FR3]|uniref:Hint domain-containing protein n=1 Tax=Phaeovulum sp. W22_SRMD_FR3 TaxID=3240274 RepID=UPI003F965642